MIVREKSESWLGYLFHLPRGSAVLVIKWRLVVLMLWACGITYLEHLRLFEGFDLTTTPFSIVGVALSIFLGFRNSAAYDRFWEGRKIWGALVNTARSTTREALQFVRGDDEAAVRALQVRVAHNVIAFVHALRIHLRGESSWDKLPLTGEDKERLGPERNKPTAIAAYTGELLREAWDRGWLDSYHHVELERRLVDLTDIQGKCERIKATPIPISHTALTHRITAIYLFSLPFGIYTTVGVLTPVVVLIVGFAFLGLDAIGDQLEDPFQYDPDDLPLNALSTMIEGNVRQRLGETDLPDELVADPSRILT